MSPVLTFICAAAGLMALLAAIGLLLGPSDSRASRRRDELPAPPARSPRRFARRPRRRRSARLAARRARAMHAVEAAHLRDLSTAGDEADRSA